MINVFHRSCNGEIILCSHSTLFTNRDPSSGKDNPFVTIVTPGFASVTSMRGFSPDPAWSGSVCGAGGSWPQSSDLTAGITLSGWQAGQWGVNKEVDKVVEELDEVYFSSVCNVWTGLAWRRQEERAKSGDLSGWIPAECGMHHSWAHISDTSVGIIPWSSRNYKYVAVSTICFPSAQSINNDYSYFHKWPQLHLFWISFQIYFSPIRGGWILRCNSDLLRFFIGKGERHIWDWI